MDESILNKRSKKILESLRNVKCGQDVFEALHAVPIENLKDMEEMIKYILKKKILN